MNINNITSLATTIAPQNTGDAAGILVFKKALQAETISATALIEALPTPSTNLPLHLGQNVNTTA